MPVLHIPTPLEQLGNRPFSFYPAIVNVDHNEWIFRRSDYDEIRVLNTKSSEELWIPRRFLTGVSSIEEPVVIVGLVKELEYREGVVVPHVRRVIEMPLAANDVPRTRFLAHHEPGGLAQVVGIRVENEQASPRSRTLLTVVSAGILASILSLVVFRDATGSRVRFFAAPQRVSLPFTAHDDFLSVVNRVGHPAWEQTVPTLAGDGLAFYMLGYPDRAYTVVLYGSNRDRASYIGALNRAGRTIHAVKLSDGADSSVLLSTLRRR